VRVDAGGSVARVDGIPVAVETLGEPETRVHDVARRKGRRRVARAAQQLGERRRLVAETEDQVVADAVILVAAAA
jgi:hypothetical protein